MDVNRILLDILVVLLAAKVGRRARRPGAASPRSSARSSPGVIVGPSVLGWVHTSEALQTLAQLGVILLLLEVGLEMDLDELGGVGRAAVLVAFAGVAVPMVTGVGAGLALGMSGKEALFVGAALTATSVGITARVFGDLRALATVEAKTVLGRGGRRRHPRTRHPDRRHAHRHPGFGLDPRRRVGRRRRGRFRRADDARRRAVRSAGLRLGAALQPFARHARRDRARVHARGLRAGARGASSRRSSARSSPGSRWRGARPPAACAASSRPVDAPARAGVLPADRHRGRRRPVRSPGRARDGRGAARHRGPRQARLGRRLDRIARRSAAHRDRHDPARRGRPDLRDARAQPARLRPGRVRRAAPRRARHDGRDAARCCAGGCSRCGSDKRASPVGGLDRRGRTRARRRATGSSSWTPNRSRTTRCSSGCAPRACARGIPRARRCSSGSSAFPPGPRRWDDASREEFFELLRGAEPRSWRMLTASGVLQRCLPELDDALVQQRPDALDLDPLAALRFERLARVHELVARRGRSGLRAFAPARRARARRVRRRFRVGASASRGAPCSGSISALRSSSRSPRSWATSS